MRDTHSRPQATAIQVQNLVLIPILARIRIQITWRS
jgi:hypothetical protein